LESLYSDWVGCCEGVRLHGSVLSQPRIACVLQNQTCITAAAKGVPLHTEQSFPHIHALFDVFLLYAVKASGTAEAQLRSFLFIALDKSKYFSDLL
jgi:hypothetical protein